MANESHLPVPGDVVAGKYRVERLLGQGGMGAVFAAQHMLLNQPVALKLLLGELADNPEATRRFLNEARAAAQIRGEHVVRVLDIGQLPTGAPFMVLEYLEGLDLAHLLHQRGPLPVSEVADYALQALDALAQAHAAGIVHRDLKPANLFLARRHDGTSLVKVLDFGISKNLAPIQAQGQGEGAHGMTSTRALLGSPEYMSPEQLRNPRGVDTRTDIWSMGVILYELLTGKGPFKAETLAELFVAILESTPAPIRTIRGDVPPSFEAVITRCLARDPNARFAHVGELAASLMVFASDQMRAMAAARGVAPAAMSSGQPLGEVTARTANTAAPWANTGTGGGATAKATARRTRVVGTVAAGVLFSCVALVLGGLAVTHFVNRGDPALQASGASAAPSGAPSGPAMVNVAPVPIAVVPAAAAHDAGAPSRVAPAPVTPGTPKKEPPAVPSKPAPAPAPASNCNPNYYFDKDGNKHFKPECF